MQTQKHITTPQGTLPATDRVKAVEAYLNSCRTETRERMIAAHVRGDLREVVEGVRAYFGTFIGIEITVRDAVQNIILDEMKDPRNSCSACGTSLLVAKRDETDPSLCNQCACGVRPEPQQSSANLVGVARDAVAEAKRKGHKMSLRSLPCGEGDPRFAIYGCGKCNALLTISRQADVEGAAYENRCSGRRSERPRPGDRMRAAGREQAPFTATSAPCVYCGKAVKDSSDRFSVEITTAGEFVFETEGENPENSQGWHSVGSDCARVLRRAGVRVIEPRA